MIKIDFLGGVQLNVICFDEHFMTDLLQRLITGRQPLLSFLKYQP